MMNVRKMMARLHAARLSMGMGRGGIPELTPQDIAAAIGMVPHELSREVFCSVWWPEGASLTRHKLMAAMRHLMMNEYSARSTACQIAKLELHIAECEWEAKENHGAADQRRMEQLRQKVAIAKFNRWPEIMGMYPSLCQVVLLELGSRDQCTECDGHGSVAKEALSVVCPICKGEGSSPISDSWRARQLKRDESCYRRTWRPVYDWIHALVSECEDFAARAIAAALGPSDA